MNALPSVAGRISNRLTGLRRARRSFVASLLVVVALLTVVAACSGVADNGTTRDTLATQAARRAQVPSPPPGASPGSSPGAPAPLPAGDAAAGQALYSSQGCQGCHSVDGSKLVGPSWKGIYGQEVELADGTTVTADDVYIHESIVQPQAKIVKGFTSVQMPPFPNLTTQQIADIIAYIKTLE